jgi:hypothetical protein
MHLILLAIAFAFTILFAAKNAVEEQLGSTSFVCKVVLAAVISQIPGMLIALTRTRTSGFWVRGLLVPAYMIAVTGVCAYAVYAFNGKADSLNSAAHMHVIFFPVMHCVFGVLAYLLTTVCMGLAIGVRRLLPSQP